MTNRLIAFISKILGRKQRALLRDNPENQKSLNLMYMSTKEKEYNQSHQSRARGMYGSLNTSDYKQYKEDWEEMKITPLDGSMLFAYVTGKYTISGKKVFHITVNSGNIVYEVNPILKHISFDTTYYGGLGSQKFESYYLYTIADLNTFKKTATTQIDALFPY